MPKLTLLGKDKIEEKFHDVVFSRINTYSEFRIKNNNNSFQLSLNKVESKLEQISKTFLPRKSKGNLRNITKNYPTHLQQDWTRHLSLRLKRFIKKHYKNKTVQTIDLILAYTHTHQKDNFEYIFNTKLLNITRKELNLQEITQLFNLSYYVALLSNAKLIEIHHVIFSYLVLFTEWTISNKYTSQEIYISILLNEYYFSNDNKLFNYQLKPVLEKFSIPDDYLLKTQNTYETEEVISELSNFYQYKQYSFDSFISDEINEETNLQLSNKKIVILDTDSYNLKQKSVNIGYQSFLSDLSESRTSACVVSSNSEIESTVGLADYKVLDLTSIFTDKDLIIINSLGNKVITLEALLTLKALTSVLFSEQKRENGVLNILKNIHTQRITKKVIMKYILNFTRQYDNKVLNMLIRIIEKENVLREEIYGQDEMITQVSQLVKGNLLRYQSRKLPLLSLIIYGPKGYGKRHIAQHIKEILFPSGVLTYVNFEKTSLYSRLTTEFQTDVLYIDNVENISKTDLKLLLKILKNGEIVIDMKKLDFRKSLIFISTSHNSNQIFASKKEKIPKTKLILKLKAFLNPDIVRNVDGVYIMNSYTIADLKKILKDIAQENCKTVNDTSLMYLATHLKNKNSPFEKALYVISRL